MQDVIVIQNQFGTKAVHRFKVEGAHLTKDELFEALNGVGPFHALRNRISLSMTSGDIIGIDGEWWLCESIGWSVIESWEADMLIHYCLFGPWPKR